MKSSSESKGHKIYVPVIFPPCTDIYFISKNIDSKSFEDEVRKKIIEIVGRNLISMYDTCGFNPLLLLIDAESPSKLDSLINSARERGIDIHPTFISFTASPKSIIKRFGMVVDQDNEKKEDLLDKIKENQVILDLLELITDKLQKIPATEYSNEKEGLIKEEIENVKNKDAKALIGEINKFRIGDVKESLEEEKVKAAQEYLDEKFIKYIPIDIPSVLGIIFLRFPIKTSRDDINSVIGGFKEDPRVIDIYEIIGEYDYIIKVHQESISKLHSFCEKLYDKKIQTIMKCVLRMWKEEGWEPAKPIFPVDPPLELSQLQKDILRILCDERRSDILKEDIDEQIGRIRGLIRDLGLGTRSYTEVKDALKGVRKKVIYRTSVKLERTNWLKTMIFITAARGHKRELKTDINAMLLGVDEKTFARKYYHVTGIVDFIVLLDCKDIYALRDKIGKFSKECGNKIRDIRIYFELERGEEQTEAFELTPRVLARINSLIPNSENFKEIEYGTVNEENMEGYPTRYYYYEWEIKNRKEEIRNLGSAADAQDRAVSSFPQVLVDLIPASEIHPEVMIHAYVRFKFSEEQKFRDELNKIVQRRRYPFLKKYDPIQDHTVVECIIVTKGFEDLFKFVKRLDRYCKLSEVNLIFHQEFFKPAIPEGLRCKPCRLPLSERCDACPQYIKPRERIDVRDIDLKINEIKRCQIAVVQLNLGENIDPLTPWYNGKDKENVITDLGGKVIEFLDEAILKKADIVVFPEMSIPESLIEKIKEWIKKQKRKIIVVAGSHLHHYPEDNVHLEGDKEKKYLFSLQEEIEELEENLNKDIIPEELKKEFGKNNFFLSDNIHVKKEEEGKWVIPDKADKEEFIVKKEDGKLNIYEKIKYYNTCPVLISDGEEIKQYDVHKNAKSPKGEIKLEHKYDIKIEEGCGMLRFINTGFGDFSILICYDFLEGNMFNALTQKIDFLIVPCWNQNTDRSKARAIVANGKRWFTILANNGSFGESGLYAPYKDKGKDLEELEQKILREGTEKVECYPFDVLELDRARDRDIWDKSTLTDEEKRISKKFERPDSTASITPRHKEHWKNGEN